MIIDTRQSPVERALRAMVDQANKNSRPAYERLVDPPKLDAATLKPETIAEIQKMMADGTDKVVMGEEAQEALADWMRRGGVDIKRFQAVIDDGDAASWWLPKVPEASEFEGKSDLELFRMMSPAGRKRMMALMCEDVGIPLPLLLVDPITGEFGPRPEPDATPP